MSDSTIIENLLVDLKTDLDYEKIETSSQTRIAFDVANIDSKNTFQYQNVVYNDRFLIKSINKKLKEADTLITKSDKVCSFVYC